MGFAPPAPPQKKHTQGKGRPGVSAQVVKVSDSSRLKIFTPKQTFQRLSIVLAQEKAGKTSENLLNEIRQIMYSLY